MKDWRQDKGLKTLTAENKEKGAERRDKERMKDWRQDKGLKTLTAEDKEKGAERTEIKKG